MAAHSQNNSDVRNAFKLPKLNPFIFIQEIKFNLLQIDHLGRVVQRPIKLTQN